MTRGAHAVAPENEEGREIRVKKEKIKAEKMSRAGNTSTSNQGQEPTEQVEDEESSEGDDSNRGSKRVRVNERGDSIQPNNQQTHIKTLPRDDDGYIPGSIVRIQLKNFLTYDYVECRPGPYLNMIIGPNGTGKSTLACAICIGLNWPPSVLGRATEVTAFVKNDKPSGYVELELKGPKGRPNLVIRREIRADSKATNFTLNKKQVSGKEIQNQMRKLNVQVGNLCSFLPQDKVSEFAAMSPQQLLRETQRAAGDTRMEEWHLNLIETGKELKNERQKLTASVEQLRTQKERNEALERDVIRYRERESLVKQIQLLEILIPVQQYREIREVFFRLKTTQRQLHQRVKLLKEKNAPAHALLKEYQEKEKIAEQDREAAKKVLQKRFNKMKEKYEASSNLEEDIENATSGLKQLKAREKERLKQIKALEKLIADKKAELERKNAITEESGDEINEQLRQLSEERRGIRIRWSEAENHLTENATECGKWSHQKDAAQAGLSALNDKTQQKYAHFRSLDRDHGDAVDWLRKNRPNFKMPVFDPAVLSLTVKPEMIDIMEAFFSFQQQRTFVAQCQEDYDTFNRRINDEKALGRPVTINVWFRPLDQRQLNHRMLTVEQYTALGFTGYLIDYIDCPEELKWWLVSDVGLANTLVCRDERKVNVNETMNVLGRLGGGRFVAGNTLHVVTRSAYGKRAVSSNTRDIQPGGKYFNVPVADPRERERHNQQLLEATHNLQQLEEAAVALKAECDAIKAEDSKFDERDKQLKERKRRITQLKSAKEKLQREIINAEKQLQQQVNAPSPDEERRKLKKKLVSLLEARVNLAGEYARFLADVVEEADKATAAGFECAQMAANAKALQELCDQKDERYQTALAEYHKANNEYEKVKKESIDILNHSRAKLEEASDEINAEYEAIDQIRTPWEEKCKEADNAGRERPPPPEGVDLRSAAELAAEMENLQAQLDLNAHTNAGVIKTFDARQKEIETLTASVNSSEESIARYEKRINTVKGQWLPALQGLIASIGKKFSEAFDAIGCAGEIRLHEHEDYDKWAIDILVKFRDDEKLQLLTGQRQSGGERSLTTILYLMSLTEEARAPFSLVDEINQGMDSRAERMVHNSMVRVTCKDDAGQYFLITPKLLADLNYHERMKILCVNNGEWLPDEDGMGNMMGLINGYLNRQNSTNA